MISVDARGRMGNQMFQLAFAHAAARRLGTSYVFGDAPLWESFELGEWGRRSARLARKARFGARYGSAGPEQVFVENDRDPREVLGSLRDHAAYGGFFQSERYFTSCEDDVRKLFAVRAEHQRAFAERYRDLGPYTCVHVRRADYLEIDGWPLPTSYFSDALVAADAWAGDRPVLVVSDGLDAARAELGHLPGLRFEANSAMVDLLLLMHADKVILSNSSFSWWGAWLNRRPGHRVLAPEHWVGFKAGIESPETSSAPVGSASWCVTRRFDRIKSTARLVDVPMSDHALQTRAPARRGTCPCAGREPSGGFARRAVRTVGDAGASRA